MPFSFVFAATPHSTLLVILYIYIVFFFFSLRNSIFSLSLSLSHTHIHSLSLSPSMSVSLSARVLFRIIFLVIFFSPELKFHRLCQPRYLIHPILTRRYYFTATAVQIYGRPSLLSHLRLFR